MLKTKKIINMIFILFVLFIFNAKNLASLYLKEQFVICFLYLFFLLVIIFIYYNIRFFILLILKKNINFKHLYKFFFLKIISFKVLFKKYIVENTIYVLTVVVDFYLKRKYYIFTFFFIISILNSNYKLAMLCVVNATSEFIYNHSLFQKYKVVIEKDLITYKTHWSKDTDLRVITFFTRFLFFLGLLITFFAFTPPIVFGPNILNLFPFEFDGYQFNLGTIQLVLAVNLIGPKLILLCFIIIFLFDIHVIFVRNTKTFYRFFAIGGKMKIVLGVTTVFFGIVERADKITIVL